MTNDQITKLSARYLLPTYARFPISFVRGSGAWLWDANGKKYLDFFAGLAVCNLGHSPKALQKVLVDQAKKLWHVSNLFGIHEQARLAKELCDQTGFYQGFFCNSGAEANEACIKFARYHSIKKGNENRTDIIVASQSFHGRTLGALSATMQKKYQIGFGPLVPGFRGAPFNDAAAIDRMIDANTCAVLVEPIQGEGGVNVPGPGYLPTLRKICTAKNVALIFDEVQVGMGRTGHLFAHQYFEVKPDMMAISKALGGGMPIGACLVNKDIALSIQPGIHASTFGGNPLACRVALEAVKQISKPSFLKRVRKNGQFFSRQLELLKREVPVMASVRGVGLMLAVELKADVGMEVVKACMERGLLINAIQGRVLRFVPPLIVEKREIEQGIEILRDAMEHLPAPTTIP